jgi:DNA helicase HerA-like ATPase
MITTQWRVSPELDAPRTGIWLGAGGEGDGVWLGSLAETGSGARPKVWLATGKEQVIAVVGKRGSGKSFTLGVIAEGLAANGETALSRHDQPRAVLLFDPLDVYWTTRYGVAPTDNAEAERHYQLAKSAGVADATFNVEAWIPGASNRRLADPSWFQTLELPTPQLGLEEWELLLGVNVMSEPIGQAFADLLALVRDAGYHSDGEAMKPSATFDLNDLAVAVGADELEPVYHRETLRALRQRLSALGSTGLFSAVGTSIQDLLSPGRLSIVMLGRVPQSYRTAVVAVLTRMLIDRRSDAAFAEKRLALDPELTEESEQALRATVGGGVPRTAVMLDEAQSFLSPGEANPARTLFVRLVKEGRNMGLSAVIATQQPSAIDARVLSQVETFVAHQLVTEPDIRAVRDNLKSRLPEKIQFASQTLDFAGLLRQLPAGVSFISAADINTTVRRSIIASVRPRATVHGGIEL